MLFSAAEFGGGSYEETFVSVLLFLYLELPIGCDFVEHLKELAWMCMVILIGCFFLVGIDSIVSLSDLAGFHF